MMKGFLKSGKWMGVAIAAVALVFAGCAGGGDNSSSEPALVNGPGVSAVPITVNPGNHSITIGDGTGAGHRIDGGGGHMVDILNGSTGCVAGVGSDASCWIKVINRDPSYWAANLFVFGTSCATCAGAQIGNADLTHANALNGGDCGTGAVPLNPDGEAGCGNALADINGLGICYVEDGEFKATSSPNNVYNCKVHDMISSTQKPYQMLHPQCGGMTERWDFTGTPSSIYTFLGSVQADWFPQNPNLDARMDMTNKGTFYVMAVNLNNNAGIGATPNGQTWLRPGSYRRSQVMSGWNASASNVVAPGSYFAVDVAMEFSDRMESQEVANTFGNKNYEYYYTYAYVLHYDPSVVQFVVGKGGKRVVGLTTLYAGYDLKDCYVDSLVDYCSADTRQSFMGTSTITPIGPGNTWVALIMDLDNGTGNASFAMSQLGTYATFYGGVGHRQLGGSYYSTAPSYPVAPKMNAHYGRAHLNIPKGGSATWTTFMTSGAIPSHSFIVKQEGVDAAPDLPLGMYYFYVKPTGTSGKGSEFWIDMLATATFVKTGWTNGSIYPSGQAGGSDDWITPCVPMQAGFMDNTNQGCDDSVPINNYWIYHGVEVVNTNIGQSGTAVTGGITGAGAMQQWSANICVQ